MNKESGWDEESWEIYTKYRDRMTKFMEDYPEIWENKKQPCDGWDTWLLHEGIDRVKQLRHGKKVHHSMTKLFKTEKVIVQHFKAENVIILNPATTKGDISFKPQDLIGIHLDRDSTHGAILQIYTRYGYITYYFKGEYFDVSLKKQKKHTQQIKNTLGEKK